MNSGVDAGTPAVAVMLSGGGRTLANLLEQIGTGRLPARVAVVIASRECRGAEIARAHGLPTVVEPGTIPVDRLGELLSKHGAGWIVLAGYLKMVRIPPGFDGRVVNIHPALLPKFGGPGMHGEHVHAAVIAAGERESGCTVHLCDAAYDTGPIVLQERVPVLAGDTPQSLAARVFEAECRAYPEALRRLFKAARGVEPGAGSGRRTPPEPPTHA